MPPPTKAQKARRQRDQGCTPTPWWKDAKAQKQPNPKKRKLGNRPAVYNGMSARTERRKRKQLADQRGKQAAITSLLAKAEEGMPDDSGNDSSPDSDQDIDMSGDKDVKWEPRQTSMKQFFAPAAAPTPGGPESKIPELLNCDSESGTSSSGSDSDSDSAPEVGSVNTRFEVPFPSVPPSQDIPTNPPTRPACDVSRGLAITSCGVEFHGCDVVGDGNCALYVLMDSLKVPACCAVARAAPHIGLSWILLLVLGRGHDRQTIGRRPSLRWLQKNPKL